MTDHARLIDEARAWLATHPNTHSARKTDVKRLASALEAQLAETARRQAVIDGVKFLLDTPDTDGVTWWTWIEDGLGGTLHSDLHAVLASAGSSSALEAVKADTWDEGHLAGWDAYNNEISCGNTPSGPEDSEAVNPYRPVETEGESRG